MNIVTRKLISRPCLENGAFMTSVAVNHQPHTPSNPDAVESVMDLIRTRRSVGRVLPDAPSKEQIETILEAGTWAPSHHQTEPWRFWVLSGEALQRFGRAMGDAEVARLEKSGTPEADVLIEKAIGKALRAPVIIALAAHIPDPCANPEIEEIAAASAAGQNMLLAAHAQGLAAMWRTGRACYSPEVRDFFGLSERDQLLGFIYLGYPDPARPAPVRTRQPVAEVTTWLAD